LSGPWMADRNDIDGLMRFEREVWAKNRKP